MIHNSHTLIILAEIRGNLDLFLTVLLFTAVSVHPMVHLPQTVTAHTRSHFQQLLNQNVKCQGKEKHHLQVQVSDQAVCSSHTSSTWSLEFLQLFYPGLIVLLHHGGHCGICHEAFDPFLVSPGTRGTLHMLKKRHHLKK